MERPATMKFNSSVLSRTSVTGRLPKDCKYKIDYAQAEQIEINEGNIICQYFSHYLFFIEVIEFRLNKDLDASYLVDNSNLFLFLMLEGKIDFSTPDGVPIADAKKGICYATYNKAGEYQYQLSVGIHWVCYLCPRTAWITKNLNYYPRLKPFMENMENSVALYGHMAACQMNSSMNDNLTELFSLADTQSADLETLQSGSAKKLISEYQKLVDNKLGQRAYRIKDYLEANYANPELNNQDLVATFNTTEKTLIENFKDEFNTTPYTYLIQIRMEHAKRMLTTKKKQVSEVYSEVGYKDIHSFSIQFKKSFGYPPSGHSKGLFLPFF